MKKRLSFIGKLCGAALIMLITMAVVLTTVSINMIEKAYYKSFEEELFV
ncbi:MAG: hypothetical protein K6A23_04390 [Butyrivibrio sp.]|nr:hypothetical protein [Butyrivibrio sp.]